MCLRGLGGSHIHLWGCLCGLTFLIPHPSLGFLLRLGRGAFSCHPLTYLPPSSLCPTALTPLLGTMLSAPLSSIKRQGLGLPMEI